MNFILTNGMIHCHVTAASHGQTVHRPLPLTAAHLRLLPRGAHVQDGRRSGQPGSEHGRRRLRGDALLGGRGEEIQEGSPGKGKTFVMCLLMPFPNSPTGKFISVLNNLFMMNSAYVWCF